MASIQNEGWNLALRFQGGDERMPDVNARIENLRKQFTGREFMVSDEMDWAGKKSAIVILQRVKPKVEKTGWEATTRTKGRTERVDFQVGGKAYDLKNQQRKAITALADKFDAENKAEVEAAEAKKRFEATVGRVGSWWERQAQEALIQSVSQRQGKTIGSLHHLLGRFPKVEIVDWKDGLKIERHNMKRRQFALGPNGFFEVGATVQDPVEVARRAREETLIEVTVSFLCNDLADAKGGIRQARKMVERLEKDGLKGNVDLDATMKAGGIRQHSFGTIKGSAVNLVLKRIPKGAFLITNG